MTFKSVFYLKNIKKQLGFFMILCVDAKNKKIKKRYFNIFSSKSLFLKHILYNNTKHIETMYFILTISDNIWCKNG